MFDKKIYNTYYQVMAERCLETCPVIIGINNNTSLLDALPDRHANALSEALKATDTCRGPAEIEVEHQEGFLLWSKTVLEAKVVCGHFKSSKSEITEAIPAPVI